MKELGMERSLCLTEEEALGLLDIIVMCPDDFTPEQRAAVAKLSEFCRQFMREGREATPLASNLNRPQTIPFVA